MAERSEHMGFEQDVDVAEPKLKKPSLYQVILLNDDYTPMEFVVHVLEKFFSLNKEEAIRIMLQVHEDGRGICGVYARDVAETLTMRVNRYARDNKHPLLSKMEAL